MSDEEETNEMLDSSSEVSGQPMKKKKKKKKKLPHDGEVDRDLFDDGEESSTQNSSKKSKKKKKKKPQSSRSETSPAFDGESDVSSKKKKHMSQINEDFDQRESDYDRHHFEEEQTFGSSMDSSRLPPEARNERGRYNGQPPPMHGGSYDDNDHGDYDHDDLMSAMGNNDPVDGYNQDYIGEEDEEEPRFKYSTADLEDTGWRNQKCTLIAAGVFFVIIAITVSIFLAKLRNTANEDLRGSN